MTEKIELRVLKKIEMKMALEQFEKKYKKVSGGIKKIYSEAMLTDNQKKIDQLHSKFFGYILKSKKAKEKWEMK